MSNSHTHTRIWKMVQAERTRLFKNNTYRHRICILTRAPETTNCVYVCVRDMPKAFNVKPHIQAIVCVGAHVPYASRIFRTLRGMVVNRFDINAIAIAAVVILNAFSSNLKPVKYFKRHSLQRCQLKNGHTFN